MIALSDDFDQSKKVKVKKISTLNSNDRHESALSRLPHWRTRLAQTLSLFWARHKRRRTDRLAVNQLMQLDDTLLKDMGLTRTELLSIQRGSLSFDALVKRSIVSSRDNNCTTSTLRK